tara:strand:+ start:2432 stop:3571 length:1140 start_codon:yes stop_codon:yes gene_type:complete
MISSVKSIEVFVYRAPVKTPVITSFGTMSNRPAVIIKIDDDDGHTGWGEVWCNYPTCGAEHRAKLLETIFAPLIIKMNIEDPEEAFTYLTKSTHTLAIQTAEIGPIAQVISGIDIAMWDIFAQKKNKPLYQVLGGTKAIVPVYASGINPVNTEKTIDRARNEGFDAFKVKVGFGHDNDIEIIKNVQLAMSEGEKLMVDANQAWELTEAISFFERINEIPLNWVEEPIQADRSENEWQKLSSITDIRLAAGENIRGLELFNKKIKSGNLGVIQPDICKWGGISANLMVVKEILNNNIHYCPHFLGGGIGLIASAHMLAGSGGDGMLEVDYNTNPLREGLASPFPKIIDSKITLNNNPGLGVTPDFSSLEKYLVYHTLVSN